MPPKRKIEGNATPKQKKQKISKEDRGELDRQSFGVNKGTFDLGAFPITSGHVDQTEILNGSTVLGAVSVCFPDECLDLANRDQLFARLPIKHRPITRSSLPDYRSPRKRKPCPHPLVRDELEADFLTDSLRSLSVHDSVTIIETVDVSTFYNKPRWVPPKFSRNSFRRFLAIAFFGSLHRPPSARDMWRRTSDVSYNFVRKTMSRDEWEWHWKCLRMPENDLISLEDKLNDRIPKIWMPANASAVDESVNPYKGRKNPHHIHIPRKPKGNGLKVSSHAHSISIMM